MLPEAIIVPCRDGVAQLPVCTVPTAVSSRAIAEREWGRTDTQKETRCRCLPGVHDMVSAARNLGSMRATASGDTAPTERRNHPVSPATPNALNGTSATPAVPSR